jgi:LuxR family maltose regulon positive regulatory protein
VRTKTQLPRIYGETLYRERLENLGSEVLERLLTLVMAPPGCGKSTLARQWAEAALGQGKKVAWFAIDADDNDPSRFLPYLLQAVAEANTGNRNGPSDALNRNSARSTSELSSALINGIAESGEELLIVLDGYSWITDRNIHDQIAYVLANAPANLHLVILTSDLPPLPIGRLRARNQLLELNSSAIRFTKAETLELFRKNTSGPVPYVQLEELYRFTQGWAAAVRIISSTIGNLGNSPALVRGTIDCRILDAIDQYLDDLFASFPDDLFDMMVDTSIVESVSLPLCLALSDDEKAETYFSQIRQQQILIPADPERGSYTYPAPVRRYLNKLLLRKGNRYMAMLHRRAHDWYAANQQWDNTVDHLLAVGNTDAAIQCMETHGMPILKLGSYGTLIKWHQKVSGLSVTIPERVWLSFAWAYAVSDKPDMAFELLEHVAAASPAPISAAVRAESKAICAVAFVLSDRIVQAMEAVAACPVELLADRWTSSIVANVELYCHLHTGQWTAFFSESTVLDSPSEGESNTHVLRLSIMGWAALLRGQAALAERYAIEALNLAPATKAKDFFGFSAWPSGLLATLYYEQGRLDELQALLANRLEAIAASGYLDCTLSAFIAAARTASTQGNLAQALAILDRAEGIAVGRKWARLQAAILLERIRLFLDEDLLAEAEGCQQRLTQLSRETGLADTSPTCSPAQMAQIGQAYLAIHVGQAEQSIVPLSELLALFTKNGNELFAVRTGTLLSIAHFKVNHNTEAERVFREVMARAEKAGFVRSVLDQGAETVKLLNGLSATLRGNTDWAKLHGHCERLLAAVHKVPGADVTPIRTLVGKATTGSSLTPKEHDVLTLIARGQSNKEIARSLNVAPETIKTHLKNIFFKLSVERRIQAVAKAQALGLLAREPA